MKNPVMVNPAGGGVTVMPGTGRLRGQTEFDTTLRLADRIANLERRYTELGRQIIAVEDKQQEQVELFNQGLATEKENRKNTRQEILDRLTYVSTGGMRLQIVGLAWLVIGISLATFSPQIESWISRKPITICAIVNGTKPSCLLLSLGHAARGH